MIKTYTPPTLAGVISDDFLYFEGVKKPFEFISLHDLGCEVDLDLLERYWNDMYNLFLRKLTQFAGGEFVLAEDTVKLQALLQELIKIKALIENGSKTDIMRQ